MGTVLLATLDIMQPPLTRTLRHPRGALKVYWQKPAPSYKKNFGDVITPLIIERMFGLRCMWANPHECTIAGAGSIMEGLNMFKGRNRPVIWGSGFITDGDNNVDGDEFDIRALRGTESWKRVEWGPDHTVAFGDPGLLADCLLTTTPKKTYTLGVMPHIFDKDSAAVARLRELRGVKIIDVYDHPRAVMEQVASSQFVLSSSLHGLIAADSVGVPNAHLKISNKLLGGSYKFRDYYSAFDGPHRYQPIAPGTVINNDLRAIIDAISAHYVPPTNLDGLKHGLLRVFPYQ